MEITVGGYLEENAAGMQWDYSQWEKVFAWLPVTTIGGTRVWFTEVYRRTARIPLMQPEGTRIEYGTLFDILNTPLPAEPTSEDYFVAGAA